MKRPASPGMKHCRKRQYEAASLRSAMKLSRFAGKVDVVVAAESFAGRLCANCSYPPVKNRPRGDIL